MKSKILIGLALCSLVLLESCKINVTYVVPPALDGSEIIAYAGKTIEWAPTGQPFQIYFTDGGSPCTASDRLISDGSNSVTCHLPSRKYGDYEFWIGPPANTPPGGFRGPVPPPVSTHPGGSSPPIPPPATNPPGGSAVPVPPPGSTGPYPARVGKCVGCPMSDIVQGTQTANALATPAPSSSPALSGKTVKVYCDGTTPMADPSSLQVTSGTPIYWRFKGTYPSSLPLFKVTITDNNMCSNHPSGTVISSETDYCTAANPSAAPYQYKFIASGCMDTPNTAAITVSAPTP